MLLLGLLGGTFRNEQVAAPLKVHVHLEPADAVVPFRNEQVAAPLKGGKHD